MNNGKFRETGKQSATSSPLETYLSPCEGPNGTKTRQKAVIKE